MNKTFRTVKEARNSLCLDVGFDPFLVYKLGRCTKEKLKSFGYIVCNSKKKTKTCGL